MDGDRYYVLKNGGIEITSSSAFGSRFYFDTHLEELTNNRDWREVVNYLEENLGLYQRRSLGRSEDKGIVNDIRRELSDALGDDKLNYALLFDSDGKEEHWLNVERVS